MTLTQALKKLSPADLERYRRDVELLGKGMVREQMDGTVVYIPPKEWPNVHHFGS